jgi:hypothetical protein
VLIANSKAEHRRKFRIDCMAELQGYDTPIARPVNEIAGDSVPSDSTRVHGDAARRPRHIWSEGREARGQKRT